FIPVSTAKTPPASNETGVVLRRLTESAVRFSWSCHEPYRQGCFVPENAVAFLQHPVGMHRSVENVARPNQHPVRDASLGSSAAFGGIRRYMRGFALRLIFGCPKGCFILALLFLLLGSSEAVAQAPNATSPSVGELPSGHPKLGDQKQGANSTMDRRGPGGSADMPRDDRTVPAGSILVTAQGLDPDEFTSVDVHLVEWEVGKVDATKRVRSKARLDTEGMASFDGIPVSNSSMRYGVVLEYAGVSRASPSFRVIPHFGKRVPFRVLPVAKSIDDTSVTVAAFLFIEPLETHVYVEELYRFTNPNDQIWRSDSTHIRLSSRKSGFSVGDGGSLSVEEVPDGVILKGLIPPGVTDVSYKYELPYSALRSSGGEISIEIAMPPRVDTISATAGVGPGLGFRIAGLPDPLPKPLPEPSVERGEQEQRLLVIVYSREEGAGYFDGVSLRVSGIPGQSWVSVAAVVATLLLMLGGFVGVIFGRRCGFDYSSASCVVHRVFGLVAEIRKIDEKVASGELSEVDHRARRDVLVGELELALDKSGNPLG
ncbi:MAG: hypothetical protein FWD57_06895, partial [Polyangiaceae bacterium]|nr:hypothetical protein [Polyangiaceae bacterium]